LPIPIDSIVFRTLAIILQQQMMPCKDLPAYHLGT
jgi:hypothetical protein